VSELKQLAHARVISFFGSPPRICLWCVCILSERGGRTEPMRRTALLPEQAYWAQEFAREQLAVLDTVGPTWLHQCQGLDVAGSVSSCPCLQQVAVAAETCIERDTENHMKARRGRRMKANLRLRDAPLDRLSGGMRFSPISATVTLTPMRTNLAATHPLGEAFCSRRGVGIPAVRGEALGHCLLADGRVWAAWNGVTAAAHPPDNSLWTVSRGASRTPVDPTPGPFRCKTTALFPRALAACKDR
jgi:hypothetical protein